MKRPRRCLLLHKEFPWHLALFPPRPISPCSNSQTPIKGSANSPDRVGIAICATSRRAMPDDRMPGVREELSEFQMKQGWICPQCGRAHGPHVDTCPEYRLGIDISEPTPKPNKDIRPGLPTTYRMPTLTKF